MVVVVTRPDETVVRLPVGQRRLKPQQQLACPTNGVALASLNSDEYPVSTWVVDDNDAQELVVCGVDGNVRIRGIVTFADTDNGGKRGKRKSLFGGRSLVSHLDSSG